MKLPSAIVACILLVCVSHSSSSLIPKRKIADHGTRRGEYYLHVTERGTKFTETIVIDEEKDLEYFHVPAHNQVTEASDYLYDFKNNMAVQRVEKEGICYLGPLPETLPKPRNLKAVLRKVSNTPPSPSHRETIVQNYWVVAEQVDKILFREEVQRFCQNYPIHRLEKVELNSTDSHGSGRHTRIARNTGPSLKTEKKMPLCTKSVPGPEECEPEDWFFDIQVRGRHCTYWLTCSYDEISNDLTCEDIKENWNHQYNSVICYTVRCP